MNSKSHLYIFCPKKSSKTSKTYKIESLTFLRFKFLPLLSQSTSYSHALCHTVQRHIVLRRARSVGMPRHALRRRMPNTAGLRPRSPARWPRPWFLAYLVESFVVAGRGGTRLPACVVWGPHTQKVVFFSEISKSARQNCLKFGMRLPIGEKIRSVEGDLFG